jgi:hypothetical protein
VLYANRLIKHSRASCGLNIAQMYIDEVQDCTEATIQLAMFVNNNPNEMFLAGIVFTIDLFIIL